MRIAIVTCEAYRDLTPGEKPLIDLFLDRGMIAKPVVWNDPAVVWEFFDAIILRSIWDAHIDPLAFYHWLKMIEEKEIKSFNPIETVRNNYHKFYLNDLKELGAKITPTIFVRKGSGIQILDDVPGDWTDLILKPAISASAFKTMKFEKSEVFEIENLYRDIVTDRDLLIQSYLPEIESSGELSIMFFNRKYSHTVLKTALAGEFRVQKEFGGQSAIIHPSQEIIDQAMGILNLIEGDVLYARLDGVVRNNDFILMELELVEPELFFDLHPTSRQSFIDAFLDLMS